MSEGFRAHRSLALQLIPAPLQLSDTRAGWPRAARLGAQHAAGWRALLRAQEAKNANSLLPIGRPISDCVVA